MKRVARALLVGTMLAAIVAPAAQAQDKQELRVWVLSAFGDTVLNASGHTDTHASEARRDAAYCQAVEA